MKKSITIILFSLTLFVLCGVAVSCEEEKSSEASPNENTDYVSLLGKKTDSEEVKNFLSRLGAKEVESSAKYPHWMYPNDGVEIVVTTENTIHAIFLVKKSYLYKATYSGYIPYDLKMTDTRAEVEKKLGQGTLTSAFGVHLDYKDKNLQINFETRDENDMNVVVESIQFRTWDN